MLGDASAGDDCPTARTLYTKSSGEIGTSLNGNVATAATLPVESSIRSTVQRTFRASPSSALIQALSHRSRTPRAVLLDQPPPAFDVPLNRTITRCVIALPVRGTRATSSSGGGASPCAMALSVVATRVGFPRAI